MAFRSILAGALVVAISAALGYFSANQVAVLMFREAAGLQTSMLPVIAATTLTILSWALLTLSLHRGGQPWRPAIVRTALIGGTSLILVFLITFGLNWMVVMMTRAG